MLFDESSASSTFSTALATDIHALVGKGDRPTLLSNVGYVLACEAEAEEDLYETSVETMTTKVCLYSSNTEVHWNVMPRRTGPFSKDLP